jgi:hypothetical protein
VLGLILLSFSGGRCRDRTCDPFHVKEFQGLSRLGAGLRIASHEV